MNCALLAILVNRKKVNKNTSWASPKPKCIEIAFCKLTSLLSPFGFLVYENAVREFKRTISVNSVLNSNSSSQYARTDYKRERSTYIVRNLHAAFGRNFVLILVNVCGHFLATR